MGFLHGTVTFERYAVEGIEISAFDDSHLEQLDQFGIDKVKLTSEGSNAGFLAGDHLFDHNFSLEKNALNDALHCGVRIDTIKIPSALRKAWLQMELAALVAENPEARVTKGQRQEAKEAVETRCQDEAASGKYVRLQQHAVLWDVREGVIYLSGGGEACIDLLTRTFEFSLERITAGKLAERWATENRKKGALESVVPSVFHTDEPQTDVSWVNHDAGNIDYLGNEFLLWLWWYTETQSDTITLSDNSELTIMLNRTLSLECPRSESGKETISAEMPIKLPEAMQAIRSGKLPRKSGMIFARQGEQYEFALQAETFSINGAKIQLAETEDGHAAQEERIDAIRRLSQTVDLLFFAFCERRIGKAWTKELEQMRRWLKSEKSASRRPAA